MRLTFHTDYALRVLIFLAVCPDGRVTTTEIADSFGLSHHHLRKVVESLRDQDLVSTARGRTGGLRLSRPPSEINIGALVRGTETDLDLVECMGRGRCRISPACRLKGIFAEALTSFMGILDRYSLADVVSNQDELISLLDLGENADVNGRKTAQ